MAFSQNSCKRLENNFKSKKTNLHKIGMSADLEYAVTLHRIININYT
jgi:hypothetical protein